MSTHPMEVLFPNEFERASSLCAEYFYRYQRYDAHFSMALFYSHEPLDEALFIDAIRESDKHLILQDNLICVVFDMTSNDRGLKASENLLALYEAKHFGKKFYASYVSMEDFATKEAMRSQLFSLLNYAIKENKYNQITDGYYELEHV